MVHLVEHNNVVTRRQYQKVKDRAGFTTLLDVANQPLRWNKRAKYPDTRDRVGNKADEEENP